MGELPTVVRAALVEAQAQSGDPLAAFVYDLDALRRHVAALMAELPPGVELYYAIKANSEAPILAALAPLVHGFEISSGGEIDRLAACPQRKPFIFSGPGKLDSDLRTALSAGVEAIHLESLGEIQRLQRLARSLGRLQPVYIRINPQLPAGLTSTLAMAGTATPFGFDEADLPTAVAAVEAASHLQLQGFHVHALSHQHSVERHLHLLDFYLERWPHWRGLARCPESLVRLNVGGGIGVDYREGRRFDWARLCAHLRARLAAQAQPPLIRFEPGRFLAAFCGYYVMEVLDTKTSHGQHFLVCRGGTHQFRLPVAQGHDHPVLHLPREARTTATGGKAWTVVGQLCTPKDILSRGQPLGEVRVGDLLVLPLAGAYGYNISHADFLCHPRPRQLFLDGNGRASA